MNAFLKSSYKNPSHWLVTIKLAWVTIIGIKYCNTHIEAPESFLAEGLGDNLERLMEVISLSPQNIKVCYGLSYNGNDHVLVIN